MTGGPSTGGSSAGSPARGQAAARPQGPTTAITMELGGGLWLAPTKVSQILISLSFWGQNVSWSVFRMTAYGKAHCHKIRFVLGNLKNAKIPSFSRNPRTFLETSHPSTKTVNGWPRKHMYFMRDVYGSTEDGQGLSSGTMHHPRCRRLTMDIRVATERPGVSASLAKNSIQRANPSFNHGQAPTVSNNSFSCVENIRNTLGDEYVVPNKMTKEKTTG